MVVCLCQGVSDKKVRRAIEEGATCRRAVTEACGAGGVCGGCHRTIADMIREARAASEAPIAPAYAPIGGEIAASAA
ncbi:MAG TPA: (2Fe-2S)-binding protein [Candidatus Binatia bacterium]|nr:(2Fe-2S)-binding protein [Candidatus Binatia bacterium]